MAIFLHVKYTNTSHPVISSVFPVKLPFQDITDGQLIPVISCSQQATIRQLNQWGPSFVTPYGVCMPQSISPRFLWWIYHEWVGHEHRWPQVGHCFWHSCLLSCRRVFKLNLDNNLHKNKYLGEAQSVSSGKTIHRTVVTGLTADYFHVKRQNSLKFHHSISVICILL